MEKRLLERLPDRRRICVMLRADGWSYEEIADFLTVGVRTVRNELEHAIEAFPGTLDHRRPDNRNRLMRLVYLMGFSDAGGEEQGMTDQLDSLYARSVWLRARMIAHDKMAEQIAARRDAARGNLRDWEAVE